MPNIEANNFRVVRQGSKYSIKVPDGMLGQFNHILDMCNKKHNGYMYAKISTPKRRRSTGEKSQNNCIHGYSAQIAQHVGHDIEDVKLFAKMRAMKRGYPAMLDSDGNVKMHLVYKVVVPESTTEITTEEAGYLIDELQAIAAEFDIALKDV